MTTQSIRSMPSGAASARFAELPDILTPRDLIAFLPIGPGQGASLIAGDEVCPFVRARKAFRQAMIRHSPFTVDEIKVV